MKQTPDSEAVKAMTDVKAQEVIKSMRRDLRRNLETTPFTAQVKIQALDRLQSQLKEQSARLENYRTVLENDGAVFDKNGLVLAMPVFCKHCETVIPINEQQSAEIERLRAALEQWKCTVCHGRKEFHFASRNVECNNCLGSGLTPIASAALKESKA